MTDFRCGAGNELIEFWLLNKTLKQKLIIIHKGKKKYLWDNPVVSFMHIWIIKINKSIQVHAKTNNQRFLTKMQKEQQATK